MALIHSFEKSGNLLFRYRGQMPLLVLLTLPSAVYFTDISILTESVRIILFSIAIVISILGFGVRAYSIATTPKGTSGRNRSRQVAETLNTRGIYSMVRHPLYLGNYLMWAGILMFAGNVYYFLVVSLVYWLYYERIMFAEERYLERTFGPLFLEWSKEVPAFVPSFRRYIPGGLPFSFKAVLRREYSGLLAASLCYLLIDYIRFWKETGFQWEVRISLAVSVVFALLAFVLRTLKHNTTILDEEGRS